MFPFFIEAIKGKMVWCDVYDGHKELVAKVEPHLQGLWLQEYSYNTNVSKNVQKKMVLQVIRKDVCNSCLSSLLVVLLLPCM